MPMWATWRDEKDWLDQVPRPNHDQRLCPSCLQAVSRATYDMHMKQAHGYEAFTPERARD